MARKPLKSHYNIKKNDSEEEEEEEQDSFVRKEKKYEEVGGEALEGEGYVRQLKVTVLEEPQAPIRMLHRSEVSIRLSFLGKIATGDGYTYLKAECTGMELNDVSSLTFFKHLQFINVSDNKLTLRDLQVLMEMPYLLLLQADKNLLQSAGLNKTKYLQVIIMNNNEISSCHDIYQPLLSTLELGYNKITNVFFDIEMPELKCLDLKYNMIRDLIDWDYPNLMCLYLAGNKIKRVDGIEKLVNLRILHLRNNPIKKLSGFHENLVHLEYLNLRNCKVKTLLQVKKLRVLPALEVLIMKGTPYMGGTGDENAAAEEEEPETRVEVLAALPKLKRLNKATFSDEEKAEAKELMNQWLEDGENDEEEEEEIVEEEQLMTEDQRDED